MRLSIALIGIFSSFVSLAVVACSSSEKESTEESEGALRTCSASQCGPSPGMPNYLCDDGVTMAGPGACERKNGKCSWTIVTCPSDAGPVDAAPPGTECGTHVCAPEQTCCSGMPFPEPTCINGTICPISQAKMKKDVSYLSEEAKRELSRDLMDFRLATYRYRSETPGDREHLGFIIDDVGPSPAVMASGERVDMYGYQTMAVAALQVQAREIAELKKEVRDLKRELKAAKR